MKMTTLRKQITKPIGILLAFVLLCSVLFFPASAEQISGLKTNIGLAKVSVPSRQQFQDGYCEPEVKVTLDGKQLTEGTDYTLFYANNLNKGTAKVYIVGMGDYYGIREASFNIVTDSSRQYLYGSYLGNAGGTLSEDYHYQELIVLPAYFTGVFDTQGAYHVSAYNLYRYDLAKEEWKLLKEEQMNPAYYSDFFYDFTYVYEDAAKDGGAVFLLDYAWVDASDKVYGGAAMIFVPSKFADASAMTILQVENDGDFRAEYLAGYAEDGNLGIVGWSSSDRNVASVEGNGKVTFHKPGTVTITGKYYGLTATKTLTMEAQDITKAEIYAYNPADGKTTVIYDGQILVSGIDYSSYETVNDGVTELLIVGKGLFEGYIMRQFDANGEPVGHTHSFDAVCDDTCGSCDFTRVTRHTFRDNWMKDGQAHWHSCSVCGKQKDYESHAFNPGDAETCTVCGPLREPGDVNADGKADTDDAVYLLLHVMFGPEDYPVEGGLVTDFNDDGKLDTDDAVYLLLHVMFGEEDYPLPA